MGRRNESPEKKRRRELIGDFLKENPIQDPNDINELVKELIAQVVENGLEGELDEELGYTKYGSGAKTINPVPNSPDL